MDPGCYVLFLWQCENRMTWLQYSESTRLFLLILWNILVILDVQHTALTANLSVSTIVFEFYYENISQNGHITLWPV
jgi:hypothetical protein